MREGFKVAICEDESVARGQLVDAVKESLSRASILAEVSEFQTGEALLQAYAPGRFDALFLDVHMGEITGIETAKAVREVDLNTPIVFVTVSPEFALESYQVRAAHYLIKPVHHEDLCEVWKRLIHIPKRDERITLMVERKPMEICLNDIHYVEIVNKNCMLHTSKGLINARIGIDQLERLLPDPPFCRCHRGYIVNFDHVRSVSEDFLMENGDVVYIRKTAYARIRDQYFQSLVRKVRAEHADIF